MDSKSKKGINLCCPGLSIFSRCFVDSKYQETKFKYDLSKIISDCSPLFSPFQPGCPHLCSLGLLQSISRQKCGYFGFRCDSFTSKCHLFTYVSSDFSNQLSTKSPFHQSYFIISLFYFPIILITIVC